jgi:hypothetical protein
MSRQIGGLTREEDLKSAGIMLLMSRGVPHDATEEGRGSPEHGKRVQWKRAIQSTPPVMAESTIIQGTEVLLSPEPVTGDGISDMLDDQADDVMGGVTVEPVFLRGAGLPESA